jgi:hypothetical protein
LKPRSGTALSPRFHVYPRDRVQILCPDKAQLGNGLGFALDKGAPDAIALQAVRDALDRAGLSPKTAVEVEVKPYQAIFESMELGGSRAAFRGEPESVTDDHTPALADVTESDADALDVEIVDDDAGPFTPDDRERGSPFDSARGFNPFAPAHRPDAGLLPFDVAVSAAAEMQRNAVSRRAQRALPRGRSDPF